MKNRLNSLTKTKEICIGNIKIGGTNKIAIQSMTNTKTSDTKNTIAQINELFSKGCDIVRVAVLDDDDAEALKEITSSCAGPIVADIHYDYKLALKAIANGISKLRINPGNISNIEHIKLIVQKCKEKNIPIRIGVNSGSISKNIYEKYGNSSRTLFESAKENIEILENLDFHNIVVSVKSSSVIKTIEAYEMLSKAYKLDLLLIAFVLSVVGAFRLFNSQFSIFNFPAISLPKAKHSSYLVALKPCFCSTGVPTVSHFIFSPKAAKRFTAAPAHVKDPK